MPRQTPLFPVYQNYSKARFIDFGGWELPLHFEGGISEEHLAVRRSVGLFDVSHMGEILVRGGKALPFLDELLPGKLKGKQPGQCVYTPICRPDGGIIDDLLVYIISPQDFLLVVNAGNIEKDLAWISEENPLLKRYSQGGDLEIRNLSPRYLQMAIQGPEAQGVIEDVLSGPDALENDIREATGLSYYRFFRGSILGRRAIVSRTGYTGEDGFEIYLDLGEEPGDDVAERLWETTRGRVEARSGRVCGLGARDSLRLEARLPLYGHELSDTISPLEAGLKRFIDLEKEFIGAQAIRRQLDEGIPRVIRGIEMLDRGVPREGCRINKDGREIGVVTSGTKSPLLGSFIGLILIQRGILETGDELEVIIHNREKRARVVKTPFYTKQNS